MRKEKILLADLDGFLIGQVFSLNEEAVQAKTLSKMSKAQKRALLQHRLKGLRDILEAFGGWEWVLSSSREKQVYRELVEYRNRLLVNKPVGEVYYSLSLRKAGRRDRVRILRSFWARHAVERPQRRLIEYQRIKHLE